MNVVVPPAFGVEYDVLMDFTRDLMGELGYQWEPTSFYRPGRTRHAIGQSLDIAFRSGPLWRDRLRGQVIYYGNRWLWKQLMAAVRNISVDHPLITRVVVEADHLHIDMDPRGRTKEPRDRIELARYSPPVNNAISRTPGVVPRLRGEFQTRRELGE